MKPIPNDNAIQPHPTSVSGFFNPRALAAFALCSAGVVLGMFSVAATAPPGAPLAPATNGSWSIINSPNGGFAPTSLSAVTCVGASECWALGRTEIGHTYANTALMRWDGSSWQVVPSPSVEQKTNGLVAISCVSSSSCWAVGYTITFLTVQVQTLILHWDGSSWQIVPSPNVGNGFNALYGVSCTSDSDCWAVGFENGGSLAQTLIERWDGTSWTIHDSPNVGSQHNVLNGVTCVAASDCRAVGYTGVAGAKSALVAQWDGSGWTSSPLTNQVTSQEETLSDITCNSATDCWAVGDSYNGVAHQTLIERWNGVSWSNTIAPVGGVDNYLFSVACASPSDCWAVGHSSNAAADPSQFDQNLILHWNGSVWLPSAAPLDQGSTYANDLAGVACESGSECWAVGSMQPAGSGRPLIVRWDGTSWTSVATPDVSAKPSNFLDGVTCVSESDCWAVGFDFYGVVARSLTMHWDGTSWGIIDSPNTALDRNNYLGDVTCLSTSDCWTVGLSTNSIGVERQASSMHWNGTTWSIVSPSPVDTSQTAETAFEGVACVSSSDCWAVGFSLIQDYQALIEHWNGSAWVFTPAPPQEKSILYDVTCTGTSDCTAVGVQWTTALTGSGLYQTLVEHWDGTSWSAVTSPNTATDQDNILSAVACADASSCWAVGSSNNYSQALVERWDGISWNIVPVPQVGSILNAVTCLSASDCWAAGPYYTPNPPAQTLLMHWDGTAWTKVSSPNTSPADSNYLAGIACASSSNCWAVGQYWRKGSPQTLTLHYAPSPPLTGVVSRKIHGSLTPPGDLPLTTAGPAAIECRSGGIPSGDHTLVFSFVNTLNAVSGITATATTSSGPQTVTAIGSIGTDTHQYIVDLTGVPNASHLSVTLNGVIDSALNSGDISAHMDVLLGDVNATGRTDAGDVTQVRNKTVSIPDTTSPASFLFDVNISGRIDAGDVIATRNASVTVLP
jgi:hypothetical protein